MKRGIALSLVILIKLTAGFTQNINVGAGLSYGGPIPTQTIDSTSGKPLLGAIAGVSYSFPLSGGLTITPGVYYSFKGLDYSQSFTRDTMFTVVINGNSGTVPSFYTAYVNGRMRLHYIEIPVLFEYQLWGIQLMAGPYISALLAGSDAGNVQVVIGTGGFFDDYYEPFDNYYAIRRFEQGMVLGSALPLFKKLMIEMKVSRSFFTLYNLNKLANHGQGIVKMYPTYMQLGLQYKFTSNEQ